MASESDGFKLIKSILAPTQRKISLTILLGIGTLIISLIVGAITLAIGELDIWMFIAGVVLTIVNFGGGMAGKIYYFLKGLGYIDPGNILLFYGIPLIFQLIYLYLIVCVFDYYSKHKQQAKK